MIHQHEPCAGKPAEIDKHVGSLGRSQYQTSGSDWNIPQAGIGSDLPEVQAADVDVQDASIAAVQDPEPIHARLNIEEWPDLAVDQHNVTEVLADPGHAFDVARRVEKRPVEIELAILDNERNLVRSAGNADRIRLRTRIKFIPENVSCGEPGKNV